MSRYLRMLVALAAVFALVAAGCGGDDDDTSSTGDTESDDTSDDTASDDTETELSDDEVRDEFCAIDADLDDLNADFETAAADEDVDALRDVVDESIDLAGQASDLPLDVLEEGLEDDLAEYLEAAQQLSDDLADVDDFDAATDLFLEFADRPSDSLTIVADRECGSDDTTPDDTTVDTTPDTEASDGTAAQIVDGVLGQTPLADGPEAECIVASLEETFDGDELGGFLVADSFSADEAVALSDVFESCLPYQDLVASGIEGQLGDAAVEACVVASYEGYDWVPIFSDPQSEQAILQETVELCREDSSGDQGAPTPNPPGTVVDFLEPNIGDCWNDAEATGSTYTVVDCSEPHDWENYALLTLPDGAYPGDAVILEEAQAECEAAFDAYVGLAYAESAIYADPIPPSEETWEAGDREVICRLDNPDGTLEGSGYQAGI